MLGMKVFLLTMTRISFQSVLGVFNNKHIDSIANLIALGGLPNFLSSSRLAFLIDLTALLASWRAGSTYNRKS